jgi:hypothetical protein
MASLSGFSPASTFASLIKTVDNLPLDANPRQLSDGVGNLLPISASTAAINLYSTTITGSLNGNASTSTSASYALSSSRSVTSSLAFTASYVLNAVSSSYATTASYSNTSTSASYALSSSRSVTSSYAVTASYWLGSSNYTPTAYLSAYHTASLTVAAPNTPCTMSYSTTDFSYGGITISGSHSDKIKINNSGIYNIQFSAQTSKTTGTSTTVYIWLAKNGVEIPFSNTGVTLAGGSNDVAIPAWNFYVSASAGDSYQILFASTTNTAFIQYTPSGSVGLTGPAVPSVILTVNRVG